MGNERRTDLAVDARQPNTGALDEVKLTSTPWIAVLFFAALGLPLLRAQQLEIADPEAGAYVSGEYEVTLKISDPDKVSKTQIWVDGTLVFEAAGWRAQATVDFGEDVARREIAAVAILENGATLRSEAVVTKALRIDYRETARVILLGAVVKTRSNRPITGLTQDQFRVFENGKQLEIETFYKERLPLDLVFLLDTSSSLRDGGIDEVKYAATTFLNGLDPTDRVALYEFKGEPRKLMGFTTDRKRMRDLIAQLKPLGETALFDAALAGLAELKDRRRGRKALVLFTDGRDNIYESREKATLLRRAITTAQNNEVTMFTIGLGDKVHKAALERIAEETGGRFHFADRPNRLGAIFGEIILDLKNQYMLGVRSQAVRRGFYKLEVKVRKRGAVVYARKGYSLE